MAEDTESNDALSKETARITMADFLESSPPGHSVQVDKIMTAGMLITPDLQLHCAREVCNGVRFFRCRTPNSEIERGKLENRFLEYVCRNCGRSVKIYAIFVALDETGASGTAHKFGELPVFGPPTPSRVIKLIGPDRELFLTGRRAEIQEMGIGAFVYYRRVVENQKNRILAEIIQVSKKLKAADDLIQQLELAQKKPQFGNAIDSVKRALPQALLIDGQNPLRLLYSALSEGVHEHTDEECLILARSVRIVLGELADRIGQILKDEAELHEAVSQLLKVKSGKAVPDR